MKKLTAFCLALTLLCPLVSCSKPPEKEPVNAPFESEWIDTSAATLKEKEEGEKGYLYISIKITEIYIDCIIGVDSGKTYKVNTTSGMDFCIGDWVGVTYDRMYWDEKNQRGEIEALTVEPQPVDAKPVIYLYPETATEVSVKLHYKGHLTCTYPAYRDGWNVTATPDGILTDARGQTYNYLYWEGISATEWDMTRGFCVKGEDTAAFLEDALSRLGLTRREANEFIVYWLPLMQDNPYNLVAFQTDLYTDTAALEITPTPDTMIRVFMAFQASDTFVPMEEQELSSPARTGFTVVEWGGCQIK